MNIANKNVALLAACQGLLLTNNAILIATHGLAGYALADNKVFGTLPVTGYIVGAALTTMPISLLMRKVGRRAGFTLCAMIGILGAAICGTAALLQSFWLLCAGALVLGIYNAGGQYYRFAAADSASTDFKSKAISLVLAGGIVGGILGPETTKLTKDLLGAAFAGSYFSLAVFALAAIAVLRFVDLPPLTAAEQKDKGRPLSEIARQPAFLVAVVSGTVGYGIMNLLMVATPLAMAAGAHPFSDSVFVIQWHVIAMFAPSFFTGSLIKRFGVVPIMLAGVALNLVCVAIALTGLEVAHFWLALVALGVGWNFMFIGGTTLLTECYTPGERAKAQGANDMAVFVAMAATSVASGLLFTLQGWQTMNQAAIPVLLAAGAAMLWLGLTRGRSSKPA